MAFLANFWTPSPWLAGRPSSSLCTRRAASPRQPVSFAKRDAAAARSPKASSEASAPAPAPEAVLEVAIVGGGLSGLCCAMLCGKMKGKKRIRVYDRPTKKDFRVVNLQSSTWSKFPEAFQERLKELGTRNQWPFQRESPQSLGPPMSLFAHELQEELQSFVHELDGFELILDVPSFPELMQDPCHAVVLADGSAASSLCSRLDFGRRAATVAAPVALGLPRSCAAAAAAAALSCAQRRFQVNLAGTSGLFSMVLSDSELQELEAKGSEPLWPAMKEGLRLFGLDEDPPDAPEGVLLQPDLAAPSRYFLELKDHAVPVGSTALTHPWAFLVGESAGLVNPWPGRALNASIKSSMVLAQHLKAMAQAIRAGYPVDENFSKEYGEQLSCIHSIEDGIHSRQCQAAQTKAKNFNLSTCLEEAEAGSRAEEAAKFKRSLRKTLQRLENVLPNGMKVDEEAIWKQVKDAKLSARTLALFNASGSWYMDEPADRSTSEVEEVEEADEPETSKEMQAQGRSSYNRGLRLWRSQSYAEAAQCFRSAALNGHGRAAYALGVMLLNGEGIKKDEVSAAQFLLQAAQAGETKAMYNLGLMYQHGIGVRRDAEKASSWTLMAANGGHRKALRSKNVKIFGSGPWLDYDPKEMGVERITKEAEAGNFHAQFKLGTMHYEGDQVKLDKALAAYWFMQAAQAGLDEAQYQISRMLFQGDGVEADEAYALRFLKAAAEKGHAESMHNLGVKLYFGEGMDSDRRSAASWFLKAAEQDLPEAQNNIGWMLYCGEGVPMNTQAGVSWLEKAAERGNEEAQYHLLAIRGSMISGDGKVERLTLFTNWRGKRKSLTIDESSKVGDLRILAQQSCFPKLVSATGRCLADPRETLRAAGIGEGDHVTAIVQQANLAATEEAFALWCCGGDRVLTWGKPEAGGDSSDVQDQLRKVQQICATRGAFAAILADGFVVTWGDPDVGADSSEVQGQPRNVQQIQATARAFAAIVADGPVVTWGAPDAGGDSSEESAPEYSSAVHKQLRNVQQVQATKIAFTAFLADGSVVTWGDPIVGNDSSEVQDRLRNGNVQQVQAATCRNSLAAVLADGSAVTWGYLGAGDIDAPDGLRNVRQIQATDGAFAAILADRTVVTWGDPDAGADSSRVQDQLRNVQQIQATAGAFAAILMDGSVVTWGDPDAGADSSRVQDQLRNVQQIQATGRAFAAILADRSVVTWGGRHVGGDSSAVQDQLRNVQHIQGTDDAFANVHDCGRQAFRDQNAHGRGVMVGVIVSDARFDEIEGMEIQNCVWCEADVCPTWEHLAWFCPGFSSTRCVTDLQGLPKAFLGGSVLWACCLCNFQQPLQPS
eukprot:s979_g18.t1